MITIIVAISMFALGTLVGIVANIPQHYVEYKKFKHNQLAALLSGNMIDADQYENMLRRDLNVDIPLNPKYASKHEDTIADIERKRRGNIVYKPGNNAQANVDKLEPVSTKKRREVGSNE